MQHSAISNPYFMEAPPRERTPIEFETGHDRAHCYGCGREVLPKIIKSRFIGNRRNALAVCPCCNSVIQDPPAKPNEPKKNKAVRQTIFLWECEECNAQYPEHEKLPLAVNLKGKTVRACPACYADVHLVEK